ncbi:MAG: EAL domain-containing protein [Clostridia bacterium]
MKLDRKALKYMMNGEHLLLMGQPKWTYGKNTCNTYDLFVGQLKTDAGVGEASAIFEEIKRDPELRQRYYDWFLPTALLRATQLSQATEANITVSIAVGAGQCNHPGFAQDMTVALQQTGIRPDKLQLVIEMTEPLTSGGESNLRYLSEELQLTLMLGSFGCGFSNLETLCHVPFDGLELDASFTKNLPEDDRTCRVVVGLAHLADTLDMHLIAKGIETDPQLEFFESVNFHKAQGEMIGSAMPLDELEKYIMQYAKKRE